MLMRPARLLLFWDYDTQWGSDADRKRGLPPAGPGGGLEFECTERLLALLAQFDVPACFAVVGAAALAGNPPYHNPDQIRRIHRSGHEIASHGFQHEWIPALSGLALDAMLRGSKDALEQCIGDSVTSFVPPYNQPFDCARRLSFSRSERRLVTGERTDLAGLCRALATAGFAFCRVAYRSLPHRAADRVLRRPFDRPVRLEHMSGVTCARLNTPCGFGGDTLARLEQAASRGGVVVAYGHPHSLHSGGLQDERWLVPFLERVADLRAAGRLEAVRPRDLVGRPVTA